MDTKKLRQKILDLAIRGKLVPQDPNDEPASVLLERIRAEKEQLIKEGKIKRSKKSVASDTSHYENVPFEVPESWCWVSLSDVCNVARGGSPRPIKEYLTDDKNGINWIKIGDADKDGKYINSTKEKISPSGISKSRMVHKGDFLLTNSMSFGRPYILNIDGCIHDGWLVISPIPKTYDPEFLYYLLSSGFAYSQFTEAASGGVVSNLNSDKVGNSLFPLPPQSEQKRIVSELEKLFKAIRLIDNNKLLFRHNIEQIRSKILELAISGKLVHQNTSDEPAIELLKRINPAYKPADNRHYENIELSIPETWCWATIGDVFKHNTGKALNSSNHSGIMMDYITTSNLYWDRFDLSTVKQMPFTETDLGKCTVTKGDLLICEGGDVGRSAIWNYNYDIRIQNHIHRLRGKANICVRYFLYVFMLYKQRNYIGGKGVAIQGLSSRDLNRLVIPMPPLNEQYRIAKSVDNLFSTIDNILLEL